MPADCKSGLGSGAKRGVLEWEQIRWRLNEVERYTLERSYIGGYVYWVSLIKQVVINLLKFFKLF